MGINDKQQRPASSVIKGVSCRQNQGSELPDGTPSQIRPCHVLQMFDVLSVCSQLFWPTQLMMLRQALVFCPSLVGRRNCFALFRRLQVSHLLKLLAPCLCAMPDAFPRWRSHCTSRQCSARRHLHHQHRPAAGTSPSDPSPCRPSLTKKCPQRRPRTRCKQYRRSDSSPRQLPSDGLAGAFFWVWDSRQPLHSVRHRVCQGCPLRVHSEHLRGNNVTSSPLTSSVDRPEHSHSALITFRQLQNI